MSQVGWFQVWKIVNKVTFEILSGVSCTVSMRGAAPDRSKCGGEMCSRLPPTPQQPKWKREKRKKERKKITNHTNFQGWLVRSPHPSLCKVPRLCTKVVKRTNLSVGGEGQLRQRERFVSAAPPPPVPPNISYFCKSYHFAGVVVPNHFYGNGGSVEYVYSLSTKCWALCDNMYGSLFPHHRARSLAYLPGPCWICAFGGNHVQWQFELESSFHFYWDT